MELQWNSAPWDIMKTNVRQVQNQEQTLEVRIRDGMPDIGRVICAWGQPALRSKQWRSDGMQITGGVSVWVLYAPEDGSPLQSIQAWVPFQGKWSFPESRREGVIHADCLLRGVDARTLSPRKLMVRANVSMMGWAMEPEQVEVFEPGELPEQVYGLRKTYPVTMDVEAGEKLVQLEESFTPPASVSRILSCRVRPVVSEQSAAGGRVVFRGTAYADVLCLQPEGDIQQHTFEMAFAQFADLEREYDKDATAAVSVMLSDLETELADGVIRTKCGLVAQYIIRRQRLLQVMEDAYSPFRKITPNLQQLSIPTVLESRTEYVEAGENLPVNATKILATSFLPDHPTMYREADAVTVELPGTFGMLYQDMDGALQWKTEPWSHSIRFPAGEDSHTAVSLCQTHRAEGRLTGSGAEVTCQVRMEMVTAAEMQVDMICGLQLGESLPQDPSRPSLLLQRMGQQDLWELAKAAGSTVDAIRQANGLQEEPVAGQMLLIPVL